MPKHASSAAPKINALGVSKQATPTAADTGTLLIQQMEQPDMSPARCVRPQRHRAIDPKLKSWIDNVVVPALLDKWTKRREDGVAA